MESIAGNPHLQPHRKPNRLKGYDYSTPGSYFVTVCTRERVCWLADVDSGDGTGAVGNGLKPFPTNESVPLSQTVIEYPGTPVPNRLGRIVNQCWRDLPNHYANCGLDAFVVMPNHVHGIVILHPGGGKRHDLSEIVRGFKTFSSKRINAVLQETAALGNGLKPFPTMAERGATNTAQGATASEGKGVESVCGLTNGRPFGTDGVGNGFKPFPDGGGRPKSGERKWPSVFRWQKSFFDHVIRDDRVMDGIRRYIADNPRKWAMDPENPFRPRR